jgi:hypothetical protein
VGDNRALDTAFSGVHRGRHHDQGDYAAEISYRGERYVAGPANGNYCPMRTASDCEAERRAGDASANVLSLLTRLVVMSQSQSTAGPNVLVVPPS